jgi:hypothetical protein
MAMNPVLDRLLSPSPNEESCHIMGSNEMLPLNVRQKDMVPFMYLRNRLACAQWETVVLDICLLRWFTSVVMLGRVQLEQYMSFPIREGNGNA